MRDHVGTRQCFQKIKPFRNKENLYCILQSHLESSVSDPQSSVCDPHSWVSSVCNRVSSTCDPESCVCNLVRSVCDPESSGCEECQCALGLLWRCQLLLATVQEARLLPAPLTKTLPPATGAEHRCKWAFSELSRQPLHSLLWMNTAIHSKVYTNA